MCFVTKKLRYLYVSICKCFDAEVFLISLKVKVETLAIQHSLCCICSKQRIRVSWLRVKCGLFGQFAGSGVEVHIVDSIQ